MPAARLYFADFGRIVAIWGIVVMHYFSPAATHKFIAIPLQFAGAGVYLFFFLSGFLLSLSKPERWLSFFKRRFLKIIIPYYLLIAVVFVLVQCGPSTVCSSLYAFTGKLLFYSVFDEKIFSCYGFPLWFIGTLIQLYLIYPALVVFLNGFGWRALTVGSAFVSIGWVILIIVLGKSDLYVWQCFFPTYVWVFAFGMAAAVLYREKNVCFWDVKLKWACLLFFCSASAVLLLEFALPLLSRKINDPLTAVAYFSLILIFYRLLKGNAWVRNAASKFAPDQYYVYLLHILPPALIGLCMPGKPEYTIYRSAGLLLALIAMCIVFLAARGAWRTLRSHGSVGV